jgi:AraC-like DNA-binding protein
MKGGTVAEFHEQFVVDPAPNNCPNSPHQFQYKAVSEIGSLEMDQINHKYFSVCRGDLHLTHNALIEVKDRLTDKVAFHMLDFGLGGVPAFGETRYTNVDHVGIGECYMAYSPSLIELHSFAAQKAKPLYVEVNADYFNSLLPDDSFSGLLKEKIGKREFFGKKASQSPAYSRPVCDMYDCPLTGSLGNLMMEGMLQQFVALQLSNFTTTTTTTPAERVGVSRREKEIIFAVKEYLHANFQQNHSLLDLSKQFGINQNKLKKSFRELIGVPVIEYLYNLKMQHAKSMLYDQGMYVSEVAPIVGYKNPNHFSTAFKRKFGINPSRI